MAILKLLMKGNYKITDEHCLTILKLLHDQFQDSGIPYALVGGMGVQAFLVTAGLEHLLRRSGDIDLAVCTNPTTLVQAFNQLAAANQTLRVVHDYQRQHAFIGELAVDYVSDPGKLKGMEDDFYSAIKNAREICLRSVTVRVEDPEYLIAAKLTGKSFRLTDQEDIIALLKSEITINHEKVSRLSWLLPYRIEWYQEARKEFEQKRI